MVWLGSTDSFLTKEHKDAGTPTRNAGQCIKCPPINFSMFMIYSMFYIVDKIAEVVACVKGGKDSSSLSRKFIL